jgi:hypothetical protein
MELGTAEVNLSAARIRFLDEVESFQKDSGTQGSVMDNGTRHFNNVPHKVKYLVYCTASCDGRSLYWLKSITLGYGNEEIVLFPNIDCVNLK